MTESTQVKLLRRMTRPQGQEAAGNPLTASRAVRLALTKAANDTVGLVLTVQSVAEEVTGLDDMLGTLADDQMLVELKREGDLAGLIALDVEMRAAVLEMETMGALLATRSEPRAPTRTDKMLCDPLLCSFLSAFPAAVMDTPLAGWVDDVQPGEEMQNTRVAGLVLEDCAYRIVRLNMDLGVADRQAQLVIVLPLVQSDDSADVAPAPDVDWAGALQENIADATASLDALLHRFPVSLATAQALRVGSILPLPGCSVSSVRLLAADGQVVAQAKLGQVGGYRAVRLETAPEAQLEALSSAAAPPLPDVVAMNVIDGPADSADDVPNTLAQSSDPLMSDNLTDPMASLSDTPFDPDAH